MSGVVAAIVAGSVITAGASVYAANKQAKATNKAARLQKEASDQALSQQQQEQNQANQRQADTESILEGNTASDTQSTMLTGANGLSIDDLILGRGTTQLGGRV